ncbi:hypothetical protein TX60_14490 [Listeria monocytogenes]|uniref:hypothetical protein n=1 Tax=Listeria monocytogenes TaxID=1639 RepID=UPI000C86B928|nr:hypothetical protein [Listeria monocytogenes]EAA0329222.1 hypothetical protein [Listeria monocytogenes]EAC2933497.1 hypothetical protein [Listeria monocytogenes]EAC4093235.1 hypothetical protein [Listeria monocytogenes]EAC4247896.1 hypothetical protein [Listeria monocytogenes]EAC5914176.1 hypothetical protein [Listeria monocytogenes]
MANLIMQKIVESEITNNYTSKKAFAEKYLGVSNVSLSRYLSGEQGLKAETMNRVEALFTHYELCIIKKMLLASMHTPEFRENPVGEFNRLKLEIAKKWVSYNRPFLDAGTSELPCELKIQYQGPSIDPSYQKWSSAVMAVKLVHDNPMMNDVITLRLPGVSKNRASAVPAGKKNRQEWFEKHIDQEFNVEI